MTCDLTVLDNGTLKLAFDWQGRWVELVDHRSGRSFIERPLDWWRIIVDDGLCSERALTLMHGTPRLLSEGHTLSVSYDNLCDAAGVLAVGATFRFSLVDDTIAATAEVCNNGPDAGQSGAFTIAEVQFPRVAGVRTVSGDPTQECLVWPCEPAVRVPQPLTANLNGLRNTAPHQQPDELFTSVSLTYPRGGPRGAAMSWYGIFGRDCGLYVASHDVTERTTTLSLERTAWPDEPLLTLSLARYPLLKPGESWSSPVSAIASECGDWHAGARRYRRWAESTWFRKPDPPLWVRRTNGWLRLICLTEYGDVLFPFERLPALVDQARASGLETVFLLGWNRGGWSRNWPDYVPSERLGDEAGWRAAIAAAHARGGRVAACLSYSTVDPCTHWYKEIGHTVTLRSPDGLETYFPEVYSGLGTWRRVTIGVKPNVVACPGTREWRRVMREAGLRLVRDNGVDAVLYDAPGFTNLCFAKGHDHARPDEAHAGKGAHFAEMRDAFRAVRPDAAIFIENAQDRLHAAVDLAQPCPASGIDNQFWELYRYTFPELIQTNRELALDEKDFNDKINVSLLYGFRFDMSVFRCRGTLDDVPNYAAALKPACALRNALPDLLLDGLFRDEDGLELGANLRGKVYEGRTRWGVVVWNRTPQPQPLGVALAGCRFVGWQALGDGCASTSLPETIAAGQLGVAIFERIGAGLGSK